MGKGRLVIVVSEGNAFLQTQMNNVNAVDMAQVLAQLRIAEQEMLEAYKKTCGKMEK